MLKTSMLPKPLWWVTKCLLYCVAGTIIAGQIANILTPLIWWILHKSEVTTLSRSFFTANYHPLLMGVYGFCLGLIPIHRLKELFASTFSRFEFQSKLNPELISSRPLLWAWVPVGLIFAFRFVTYRVQLDQSVLGQPTYGDTRLEHFFGSLTLTSTSNPGALIFDRIVLAGPTLFLFVYALAVWLRHQMPESSVAESENTQTYSKKANDC